MRYDKKNYTILIKIFFLTFIRRFFYWFKRIWIEKTCKIKLSSFTFGNYILLRFVFMKSKIKDFKLFSNKTSLHVNFFCQFYHYLVRAGFSFVLCDNLANPEHSPYSYYLCRTPDIAAVGTNFNVFSYDAVSARDCQLVRLFR